MKQYYVGGSRNSTICPRHPPKIRKEMKDYKAKKQLDKEQMHIIRDVDEMDNELKKDEDYIVGTDRSEKSIRSSQSSISFPPKVKKWKTKDPMDTFFTPTPDVAVQN